MVGVSESRFTDPVQVESTTYEIVRRTHEVPIEWFLIKNILIDADSYDRYLRFESSQKQTEAWSANCVEFDYEAERDPDGTGKSFRTNFTSPEDTKIWEYFRTGDLLDLLDYDQNTHEVVEITVSESGSSLLLTVQDRLPHVPRESLVDSTEDTECA